MSLTTFLETSFKTDDIPVSVIDFVNSILKHRQPIGVIYYGSTLWKQDLTGLLDFYIVCDDLQNWYGADQKIAPIANKILPPNIEYHEYTENNVTIRAKVAILSLKQLQNATGLKSIDTTIWARFCQPVKVIWVRNRDAQKALVDCLQGAVKTASWWAAYLGPQKGNSEAFWCNLFRLTYAAELRVESKNRPMSILENREIYFAQLLTLGWRANNISFEQTSTDLLCTHITEDAHQKALSKWRVRQRLGRPLNILRLIKAAFTFQGGADYIAWKIKRHQKIDLKLTPFQKQHPIISAPWILWRLCRQGVFKR